MGGDDIIGLVAVIGLILIPSVGITARLALKPIVDSVLRVRDALDRQRPAGAADPERMARLEERMGQLQDTVDRLAETVDFHMQLQAGGRPNASLPPGMGTSGQS